MKRHPRFPGLRILDLSNPRDVRVLVKDLTRHVDDHPAVLSLLSIVLPGQTRWIGSTCAVAEDYVDRNHNIAYARILARAYRDYPRRTTRYHFFSRQVAFDDFLEEDHLQQAYLGYTILGPQDPTTLGPTYLHPPGRDGERYIPSIRRDEVNLAGNRLIVRAAPFVEQDARVSACATAALWITLSTLSKNFGKPVGSGSTTEITEAASKYSLGHIGGPFPAAGGLTLEQMLWALHEYGLAPHTYQYRDPQRVDDPKDRRAHADAHSLVYTCVESGIPVILIVALPGAGGQHAFTVIGHTYDKNFGALGHAIKTGRVSLDSDLWCPSFIGHCDQMGQYLEAQLLPSTDATDGYPRLEIATTALPARLSELIGGYYDKTEEKHVMGFYEGAELRRIVVPLLPRMDLPPDLAPLKGKSLLQQAIIEHAESVPTTPVRRLRTYLTASNSFKRRLHPDRVDGLSSELAELYRGHLLSRYVWVTELYAPHPDGTAMKDLRIMAEVLFEPTSALEDSDFVAMHLPGKFFSMPPDKHGPTAFRRALRNPTAVKDDMPYRPLDRALDRE